MPVTLLVIFLVIAALVAQPRVGCRAPRCPGSPASRAHLGLAPFWARSVVCLSIGESLPFRCFCLIAQKVPVATKYLPALSCAVCLRLGLEVCDGRIKTTCRKVPRERNQDIQSAGVVLVKKESQGRRALGRRENIDQSDLLQRADKRGRKACERTSQGELRSVQSVDVCLSEQTFSHVSAKMEA